MRSLLFIPYRDENGGVGANCGAGLDLELRDDVLRDLRRGHGISASNRNPGNRGCAWYVRLSRGSFLPTGILKTEFAHYTLVCVWHRLGCALAVAWIPGTKETCKFSQILRPIRRRILFHLSGSRLRAHNAAARDNRSTIGLVLYRWAPSSQPSRWGRSSPGGRKAYLTDRDESVENCCTLAVSFELVVHPVPPAQESREPSQALGCHREIDRQKRAFGPGIRIFGSARVLDPVWSGAIAFARLLRPTSSVPCVETPPWARPNRSFQPAHGAVSVR